MSYVFCRVNINGGVRLNSKEENRKSEIVIGLIEGIAVGTFIAILAFVVLNIWHLLSAEYAIRATIIAWITFAIIATSLYKPLLQTSYKSSAFIAGLLATVGVINYIYMNSPYSLYGSLGIDQLTAFVAVGMGVGIVVRIAMEKKSQHSRI
ncbi:MAG: hypothetical protein KAQ87_02535 [Candidatus Pacebacteria bacterium]|nr:hypothetical protein [Candidatus Paceibacterota bacterium]